MRPRQFLGSYIIRLAYARSNTLFDINSLAYLAWEVLVSSHPRAHALYADKRNLTLLCGDAFVRAVSVADDAIFILLGGFPRTQIMTAGNRDALWAVRRELVF